MFELGNMISEVPGLYAEWINKISGGNDFLAGTLGVAGLGAITYVCRSIPIGIYNSIKRRIILSIIIDSVHEAYEPMLEKLQNYSGNIGSRDFTIEPNYDRNSKYLNSYKTISGIGTHFFFYKKSFFWYSIFDLDSAGVTMQKKRISIKTFGFNKTVLDNFLLSLEKKREANSTIFYNSNGRGDNPNYIGCMKSQSLDEICLDEDVRKYIKNILDTFVNNKKDIEKLGIPDKLVIVLHGEPGNGKSKLIPAIAKYLKKNINNINASGLKSADSFQKSIICTNEVHVLEDIHSVDSLVSKTCGVTYVKKINQVKNEKDTKNIKDNEIGNFFHIKLSEFLNVLNGSVPLDGQVIIMTTNYIDSLDQAILRPGRTDYVIQLPRIKPNTVNSWLKKKINNFDESKKFTKSVRGCDIGGLLQITKGDAKEIAKQIPIIEKKIPNEQNFNFNDANNMEFMRDNEK